MNIENVHANCTRKMSEVSISIHLIYSSVTHSHDLEDFSNENSFILKLSFVLNILLSLSKIKIVQFLRNFDISIDIDAN